MHPQLFIRQDITTRITPIEEEFEEEAGLYSDCRTSPFGQLIRTLRVVLEEYDA